MGGWCTRMLRKGMRSVFGRLLGDNGRSKESWVSNIWEQDWVGGHGNVALVTSLRDGMNLVSYEFVACQASKKGVLILSEVIEAYHFA
ncbi:Alpha,alpha-trehalose-phosphate synthase [UDP-forming] 1 [Vitis vinifera]|uniref:Alpha,alpha-trehalose-phosphate synthase [UDP-forming] 1 n=1 Tax=Vitis vinifera TaxID=29760 RepID=A0A438H304_VITVI|nr:Alpha,alpha-trehalose-phosphate synthase [UDP-forming] 1 [Vitis vinifera]